MFDESLLRRLDADEEVRHSGRSAVLRRAAAEYLRRGRVARNAEAYEKAYGDGRAASDGELTGWADEGAWPDK